MPPGPLWARIAMPVQRKPLVGPADDAYEREANDVADTVMRAASPESAGPSATAGGGGPSAEAGPELHGETAVRAAARGGEPLPGELRSRFEPVFGQDFGSVRVHANQEAAEAAQAVFARAYTVGRDIVFGAGQYQPETDAGRRLLAHELTHVVQQGASAGPAGGSAVGAKPAGGAPAVQRMVMSAADQTAYTRFATFVQNEIPKAANDKRLTAALTKAGTNTGPTKRDIKADLAWGAGPTVKVAPLTGAVGEFTPGIGSKEIRIRQLRVEQYRDETTASRLPGHELYLEDAILHEYTHFLDDQDGVDRPGEEGEEFEKDTYGKVITGVDDALNNVLKGEFGPGTWTVTVESKEAAFKQRVVISSAKTGNGTLDGVVGKSVSVNADPGTKWQLKVQHDDGKTGWKDSKIHKVQEGTDNYLVRSEDWTDRDMNDLEVRVKK